MIPARVTPGREERVTRSRCASAFSLSVRSRRPRPQAFDCRHAPLAAPQVTKRKPLVFESPCDRAARVGRQPHTHPSFTSALSPTANRLRPTSGTEPHGSGRGARMSPGTLDSTAPTAPPRMGSGLSSDARVEKTRRRDSISRVCQKSGHLAGPQGEVGK